MSEAARPIHTDDLDITADMKVAGAAGIAVPTDDMCLGRDIIADLDCLNLGADCDNITAELLAFSAGTTGRPGPDVT